jgi:hypothetical protein
MRDIDTSYEIDNIVEVEEEIEPNNHSIVNIDTIE